MKLYFINLAPIYLNLVQNTQLPLLNISLLILKILRRSLLHLEERYGVVHFSVIFSHMLLFVSRQKQILVVQYFYL